jgi:DNA repair photolyase
LDFETKLFYKADAVGLLEAELSKPRYVCKPIALGINTDGYQPLEKRLGITRSILAVLARCRHPVTLVTKSALIVRDIDLLADLAKNRLVSVMVSITSLSTDIKRTLEPRAASPQARLRVIEHLMHAGIPVRAALMPTYCGRDSISPHGNSALPTRASDIAPPALRASIDHSGDTFAGSRLQTPASAANA